jgi:hypothetical protein
MQMANTTVSTDQAFDLVGTPNIPLDFWNMPFTEDFSAWSMNGGLSLDAIDMPPTTIDTQMLDREPTIHTYTPAEPSPSEFDLPPPVLDLGKIWFTNLQSSEERLQHPPMVSPATTPAAHHNHATDVDDNYRLRLSKSLVSSPPQQDPLPSSDFLEG